MPNLTNGAGLPAVQFRTDDLPRAKLAPAKLPAAVELPSRNSLNFRALAAPLPYRVRRTCD